jgi:hypothetical protein
MRLPRLISGPRLIGPLTFCLAVWSAPPAHAQPKTWEDRAFLNINMALQVNSRPFGERLTPVINVERAVINATHPGEMSTPAIEPAGGVRVWQNFGIGGAYTQRQADETAPLQALIPHPVLFNQPRTAFKDAVFERSERAFHGSVLMMFPVTPKLDIAVSGGPSLIYLKQDLVQGIEVAETGAPFTTVGIGNVAVVTREIRSLGINGAVDVTWFLTPSIGVGAIARYVQATASTRLIDGTAIDLDAGGFQIGIGARVRFR